MRNRALLPTLVWMIACSGSTTSTPAPKCPAPAVSTDAVPLSPADDELAKLARLQGEWRGDGHGEPGDSTVERTYRWILGGKYLESRNRNSYAPQRANPKGEVHEDVGYYSHDRSRKALVLRQFHVEGFVNQYVLESASDDTFVFVSEAIENIPPGFRARETLRLVGDDQLQETFEIAMPDADFAVYSKSTLTRVH